MEPDGDRGSGVGSGVEGRRPLAEPREAPQGSEAPGEMRATRGEIQPPIPNPRSLTPDPWRIASIALWTIAALVVTLLALRFGMRLVGVRDDIALPGLVYAITGPLVSPFYRLFPAPERFDYYAVEFASLAAAGAVLGAALAVYIAGLLVASWSAR